ncbi:MAG TPA: ankyrin repeat domain-containing protein [Vicinamibacterales bacterium]|jgi:catechol 2,3-dioxygenase-like lactoylglutathione lyase family enzyme|nr:ankyrin repeat domain-containing protein [Vicinamibacterales bacterium]
MSNPTLPTRASLEYLRKLAKDRLAVLREQHPHAQLATALLAVAQEHGFSSWRALKAEIDRRHTTHASQLFEAVDRGDAATVRSLLRDEPALIHARHARHNASPLHHAATCGDLATVRVLLDAGADPNDADDDTRIGVIGWATSLWQLGEVPKDVVSLLLERGGRHHIFSAIAAGDVEVIRTFVEQQPDALDQRLPARYNGQTPLHFAITRNRPDILGLLLDMGAGLDAPDRNGQTALEYALLRGDRVAAARLREAGARAPERPATQDAPRAANALADSIQKATVVVGSKDVAATLAWYTSIGFTEVARYPTEGPAVFWGMVRFGTAELSFDVREGADARGVSLLVETDQLRPLYELLTARQLESADVQFVKTLHQPEHGGLEFSVRDPNGFTLRFLQHAR